jgi:hypothetical protein
MKNYSAKKTIAKKHGKRPRNILINFNWDKKRNRQQKVFIVYAFRSYSGPFMGYIVSGNKLVFKSQFPLIVCKIEPNFPWCPFESQCESCNETMKSFIDKVNKDTEDSYERGKCVVNCE